MEMVQPYLLGAPISDAPLVTSVGRNGALQSTWCGFYFDTFQPAPTRLFWEKTFQRNHQVFWKYPVESKYFSTLGVSVCFCDEGVSPKTRWIGDTYMEMHPSPAPSSSSSSSSPSPSSGGEATHIWKDWPVACSWFLSNLNLWRLPSHVSPYICEEHESICDLISKYDLTNCCPLWWCKVLTYQCLSPEWGVTLRSQRLNRGFVWPHDRIGVAEWYTWYAWWRDQYILNVWLRRRIHMMIYYRYICTGLSNETL